MENAQKTEEKPVKPRRKAGRPSTYTPEYHNEMGFKLAVAGHNNVEIAQIFSLSESKFYEWLEKHEDFREAIARGREPATAAVADSLRQRAIGFEWFEEVPTKVRKIDYDESGKKIGEHEEIVITKVKRVAPPDTQACSLYLRNRLSEKWRDKVEYEDTGKFSIAEEIRLARAVLERGGAAHGENAKNQ